MSKFTRSIGGRKKKSSRKENAINKKRLKCKSCVSGGWHTINYGYFGDHKCDVYNGDLVNEQKIEKVFSKRGTR